MQEHFSVQLSDIPGKSNLSFLLSLHKKCIIVSIIIIIKCLIMPYTWSAVINGLNSAIKFLCIPLLWFSPLSQGYALWGFLISTESSTSMPSKNMLNVLACLSLWCYHNSKTKMLLYSRFKIYLIARKRSM